MTLYYLSITDEKIGRINDQLRKEAVTRVSKILQAGVDSGEFLIDDIAGTAKTIHNALTGMILNTISEGNPPFSDQTLARLFISFCHRSISGDSKKPG